MVEISHIYFAYSLSVIHQTLRCHKYTNIIGNKEELCKKNRLAIKKVPKYLELIENVLIFAP
jgi:hypothetical protein